jgi:TPP-dependent 2-oxoacid decarboxylase
MKLHEVLFDALYAQGVRHIFGIPGDFVLNRHLDDTNNSG